MALERENMEQLLEQVCRTAKRPNGTKEQPGQQDLTRKKAGLPWEQGKSLGKHWQTPCKPVRAGSLMGARREHK